MLNILYTCSLFFFFFFFNDTATTEIYTLSLHDALPISRPSPSAAARRRSCITSRSRTRPKASPSQRSSSLTRSAHSCSTSGANVLRSLRRRDDIGKLGRSRSQRTHELRHRSGRRGACLLEHRGDPLQRRPVDPVALELE